MTAFFVFYTHGWTVREVVVAGPLHSRKAAESMVRALGSDHEVVATDADGAKRIQRHLAEELELYVTLQTGLARRSRGVKSRL